MTEDPQRSELGLLRSGNYLLAHNAAKLIRHALHQRQALIGERGDRDMNVSLSVCVHIRRMPPLQRYELPMISLNDLIDRIRLKIGQTQPPDLLRAEHEAIGTDDKRRWSAKGVEEMRRSGRVNGN